MTNVPYNTNIPFASNSPSQDQPRMQENTNSLKDLIEIDHIGFGNNEGGYHKNIHQPVLVGAPAAILGINQIFSLVPPSNIPANGDTQLFSLTGMNGLSQMTGNQAATNGAVWCAGILFQWGQKTGLGAVTFPFVFPNTLFNVTATLYHTSPTVVSVTQSVTIDSNPVTFTTAGFSWAVTPAIGQNLGFYWFAVGN
jgi:hypothetical protein